MNSVDKIIIGGGMAYTFIYALGGKIDPLYLKVIRLVRQKRF